MFTFVGPLSLHYQIDGPPQGARLVLINSLGCDLRIWDAIVPPLAERYHLIRYDKRGHGLSDTPPGSYTIHDHTRDLAGLLNFLQIEAAVVVGISVGGLIALDLACQYPSRVRGVVVCDSAPRIGTPAGWEERIRIVRERGLVQMADSILQRWFLPSYAVHHPAEYRGYRNMLARAPQEGYIATCAALRDADFSAAVRNITTPILAICGAEDQVVTPVQMREWASHQPGASMAVIEGAAHLPCIEQPQRMAERIIQFVREECHER